MASHDQAALWSYAAGELSADRRAEVDAHLVLCADCRASLDGIISSRRMLAQSQLAPPPPVDWRRVDEGLRSRTVKRRAPAPRPVFALPLAFAGVAAAAAALFTVIRPAPAPPVPVALVEPKPVAPVPSSVVMPAPVPSARVELASGAALGDRDVGDGDEVVEGSALRVEGPGRAVVALPDGSRLRVSPRTEAVFATVRADDVAIDVKSGAVFVKAAHVARKAFLVRAGSVGVRVVGTAFSVERHGTGVEVAVAEGRVLVEPEGGEARLVAAGEVVVLTGATRRSRGFNADEREGFADVGVELPAQVPPKPVVANREPPKAAPAPEIAPAPAPEPVAPPAAVVKPPSLTPEPIELTVLRRAEESLKTGTCSSYLAQLDELHEGAEVASVRERARILRARCFDESVDAVNADREYRKYLSEFPAGRFADEARRAVAH